MSVRAQAFGHAIQREQRLNLKVAPSFYKALRAQLAHTRSFKRHGQGPEFSYSFVNVGLSLAAEVEMSYIPHRPYNERKRYRWQHGFNAVRENQLIHS